jgi:hypothetical protein
MHIDLLIDESEQLDAQLETNLSELIEALKIRNRVDWDAQIICDPNLKDLLNSLKDFENKYPSSSSITAKNFG